MRTAVIGAGMAGLAAAWHLLQNGHTVTVFAPDETTASSVSTGLLHPFPGKKAQRSWAADEGIQETTHLLNAAEQALGRPVANRNGIRRYSPDLWIEEGITVFSKLYLKGLRMACKNAEFKNQRISSLQDLNDYDRIIIAAGDQSLQFANHLPLRRVIGQSLLCESAHNYSHSLIYPGYHISVTETPNLYLVGSTYEYTPEPDPQKALKLLPPDFKLLEIHAGVRIAPKIGYRPIAQQIAPKTWILTGFGSRGLLYHAMLAKNLVHSL